VDLAVAAFNLLGRRLLIAGEGPDRDRLAAMAQENVVFLGRVSDDDLLRLLAECEAYVLPGEEDFGIAPLQAQAAGRPVIAYEGGGALDTVVAGVTGTFFSESTAEALADAVLNFDPRQVDEDACRANAARFSPSRFRDKLVSFLEGAFAGNIGLEPAPARTSHPA
jgi:glycosyltransferase involved in cell wall biosynthesis